MPTPTTYGPYEIDNLQNGLNPIQLESEIRANETIALGVSSIDTEGGVVSRGVVTGGTMTVTFKDVLPSSQKEEFDGGATQDPEDPPGAGSCLALHDAKPTPEVTQDVNVTNNVLETEVRKPDGTYHDRVYGFSCNFCDKTTWIADAVKVTDEAIGTGDGVTTVFSLARGDAQNAGERIVDLSHGKVSDENDVKNPDGKYRTMGSGYTDDGPLSGYVPIIELDGVEKTERSYAATSGGDYEIDYKNGTVTFYEAPADEVAITSPGYYYVPTDACACVMVMPSAGKKYLIDRIEIQATADAEFKDTIVNNVFTGTPPDGTPMRRPTVIKNMYDLINWAHGSFAVIPAQGGTTRGIPENIHIHRVEYITAIPLLNSYSMYLRIYLENGVEFGGTWATVVIYGMDEDE